MTKPIIAKPGYTIQPLYQWDTGQVLEIHGLSLSVVPQVHFAHEGDRLAIVRHATVDAAGIVRADIPDILLQSSARLCAYVCTEEGNTFQTLRTLTIPVYGRAKPDDYAPEDVTYVTALRNVDMDMATLDPDATGYVEKVLNGDQLTLRFHIPRGADGAAGAPGRDGVDGTVAFDDLTDAQRESLRGPQGIQGEIGPEGPQGPKGADGTMSFEDLTEEQKASLKGDPGKNGEDGSNGVTFTPSVDSAGNLSWSNNGGLANPSTVNIKGAQGIQGIQGEIGPEGPQGPTGADGAPGTSASINGVTTLTLTTGTGLSHTQSGGTLTLTLSTHQHAASDITAGTFAGAVTAAASAQDPGTAMLRNSALASTETTPTNNGEIRWQYE